MRIDWIIATLVVFATPALATVYKSTDKEGNTVFSDKETPGSEAVQLEPPNTVSSTPVTQKKKEKAKSTQEKASSVDYKITITEPTDNEMFHGGITTITLTVTVAPALRKNHSLQLYHQGQALGAPQRSKEFLIENLPRGQHIFYVEVQDKSGKQISKSASVTIHQQRPSALSPLNPNNPKNRARP